jgi:peptidoglycan/xylan/chitin deacetylase (PgdA/CDA1 family)
VQELAVPGLVEIGAHGVAHLPLTTVAPDRRRTEILGSKLRCEQLLGHPVSGFTYPHGDTDEETRAMVREAGFAYACTTDPSGIEQDRVDLYALPRVQALDWSADQIMAAFARHGTKCHGG